MMNRMAHLGAHSYSNYGGGTDGIDDIIKQSSYPDRNFWVTEFGVWCDACQNTVNGTNTWEYARSTAEFLWYYLDNNASAALVWDGYDGIYLNNYDNNSYHSSWGLLALDNPDAVIKTYTPRKQFYTVAQFSKFLLPGTRRIGLHGQSSPLLISPYSDPVTGKLAMAGVNPGSAATLNVSLTNLPSVATLDLYYTDATHNLFKSGSVTVTNKGFSTAIPANSVFTLVSPPAPLLTARLEGANLILSWPTNAASYVLEAAPNLTPGSPWTNVTSQVFVAGNMFTVTNATGEGSLFYRLKK